MALVFILLGDSWGNKKLGYWLVEIPELDKWELALGVPAELFANVVNWLVEDSRLKLVVSRLGGDREIASGKLVDEGTSEDDWVCKWIWLFVESTLYL